MGIVGGMPLYLYRHWLEVEGALRASPGVFLMLDYDGTLTPIASRPEEAVLSGDVRALLRALASSQWVKLAIVSGRPIGQLKELVGVDGVYYAGLHGLEVEGPGLRFKAKGVEEARRVVEDAVRRLSSTLSSVPGAIVEDKGLTVAVHYRLVSRGRVRRVLRAVREVLSSTPQLRPLKGKKVVELLPDVDWDKGRAAQLLLARAGGPNYTPVYVGDDETDEPAFKALSSGITVVVGAKRRTSARFYVKGVDEVAGMLKRLRSIVSS